MKNRFKLTIILLALVVISCACQREDESHHKTIRFMNNADIPIYIWGGHSYPDTVLRTSIGETLMSQNQIYKSDPNTDNTLALRLRSFYEDIFRDGRRIPSDTLMVCVLDAKLLEAKINDDDPNKAIIQYYYLSLADLKYLNWTLTYPPTPEMSVVKMYPPYQQTEQ